MDVVWDGTTRLEDAGQSRHELADAAKNHDWQRVLEFVSRDNSLVNATRPGGPSLYAPLHQAAHAGAPVEIVRRLNQIGAWRTLQNACGERPIDVAEMRGHSHLMDALTPQLTRHVPLGILLRLQANFHAVIRVRAERQVQEHRLRLPELEPLLELDPVQV